MRGSRDTLGVCCCFFCIQQRSVFFFARGHYSGQNALGLHSEYKYKHVFFLQLHLSANGGSPLPELRVWKRDTCIITFPPAVKGSMFNTCPFLKGITLIDRLCGHGSFLLKTFPISPTWPWSNPASSALSSVPQWPCHACHVILLSWTHLHHKPLYPLT